MTGLAAHTHAAAAHASKDQLCHTTCAFVEGLHDQAYCFWSHKVQTWLQQQSTALSIEDEICVSTVIDNAKTLYRQDFDQAGHSVGRYWQMSQSQHQDYVLAPYLSALKNFRSPRLVSRFRCGCHGLHVDTGQLKPVEQRVDRELCFCSVCATDTAEDGHHSVFDCPAYCSIRDRFTAIFWGPAPVATLSSFFTLHDHRVIAKLLHECFAHRFMLLEGVVGVPQHYWLAFTSSYHCHSVDEHECTKDNLIRCLFV